MEVELRIITVGAGERGREEKRREGVRREGAGRAGRGSGVSSREEIGDKVEHDNVNDSYSDNDNDKGSGNQSLSVG